MRLRYPEDPEKILSGWMPMQEYLTYAYWTPNAYAYASLLDLRNIADFYIFTQATAAADTAPKIPIWFRAGSLMADTSPISCPGI